MTFVLRFPRLNQDHCLSRVGLKCAALLFFLLDMFDKTRTGRIDLFGFSALWDFMQRWRLLFQQYDRDRSGSISGMELQQGIYCQMAHSELKFQLFLFTAGGQQFHPDPVETHSSTCLPCGSQPWPRWATTSAPSSPSRWSSASRCEANVPESSWTASSRCACSCSP